MDEVTPVFLQCNQCFSCIALEDILCFFEIGRSTHLTIRYELLVAYMDKSSSPLKFQPQTNEKKLKISSHEIFCKFCNNGLGSMIATGPSRENIPCFRAKSCTIINGKEEICGDWPTVAKFTSKYIQIRDFKSFYGSNSESVSVVKSEAVPTIRPSLKLITTCNLRELTNSKPRSYQVECFAAASLGNCIVYLPTGAGKTLIAAMMISLMQRLNPSKTIFFIVDRVPLAYQQGQYLTEQTSLNVLIACGETSDEIPAKRLREYPVIACTAQVLLNFFVRQLVSMEDASLIIFDEIHNAVKAHPYVNLLERHFNTLEPTRRPLLLGLTASPVSGDAINMNIALGQLCQLTDARVYLPCLYWDNLMVTINRPKIQFLVVTPSEESLKFTAALSLYVKHTVTKIMQALKVSPGPMDSLSIDYLCQLRGGLRTLSEKAHATKNVKAVDAIINLQQVLSAHELSSVLGPHYARKYLEDLFSRVCKNKEDLADDSSSILLSSIQGMDSLSGKLDELLNLLGSIECLETTRAIVFVQTKKTARHLFHVIESNENLEVKWKPAYLVGQSAGQLDGMSWTDHQAPILQKFLSGEHRLLISTSVLQEGLDVPICDHIILFDQSWTLTSFIQSRGRARAKESHYLLICDQTQKATYESLMGSEETMHRVILRNIRDNKSLDPKTVICALVLANQANSAVDWLSNGSETNASLMESSKDVRRNYHAIKIVLHNVDASNLSLSSFPFFDEISLKNLHEQAEPGIVFTDKNILTVSGEALAGNSLRIGDVAKLIADLSSKLTSFPEILLSYRIGAQNRNRGTEQFMFVAESFQCGAFIKPKYFNCQASVSLSSKVVINLRDGAIQVFFIEKETKFLYRLDFEFSNIDRYILLELQSQERLNTSIYIPLLGAASYYYTNNEVLTDIKLASIDLISWERASADDLRSVFSNLEFSVFKIVFHASRIVQDNFLYILRKMESFGLTVMFGEVQRVEKLDDMIGPDDMEKIASIDPPDFEFLYDLSVLKSLCSISLLYRTRLSVIFTYLAGLRKDLRHRVLTEFALALVDNRYADPAELLFSIINHILEDPASYVLPLPFDNSDISYDSKSNTTLIRYVVLTPTRLIFTAAKKMIRNRILRAFNPEYFIRVVFRDEDLKRLSTVKTGAGLKSVYKRIKACLTDGIKIGDRKYEFLAMSSSQLRDHGCWFVCPHMLSIPRLNSSQIVHVNADFIRSWCGDFSAIKNTAQYVARLGQSLSASFDATKVETQQYEVIPDYEVVSEIDGKTKKYNFSDGIGKLSYARAREITQSLNLDHIPSAFQIRYAGFKGVLAVDPSSDETDTEDKVAFQFRPSMRKFLSGHHILEVLNWSEYIPCYLNRQVLLIMSSLGVSDASFVRLQDQMLKNMPETLFDRKTAIKTLSHGVHILPKIKFSKSSYSFEAEPFFRSLLLSIYRRHLIELLTRSRVFIPMGRILMGVIDETGTLAEDEIFVQITRQVTDDVASELGLIEESTSERMVVNAKVSIAKNPCMHPGDLRRMKAVRNPLLEKYHYDCVVFPRKGKRPITDTCSGSDLDGDLYFVTWDPSLLPPSEYEPMDYSGPSSKKVTEIKLEDIIQFLVDFISNDQLGTIANAHVAHADTSLEGVKSSVCMHLAYLFSLAVDFPKTGLLPTFPKEYRVASWPDFMQKHGMTTHVSTKVMGVMFRKAKSIFYPKVSYSSRIFSADSSFLSDGHEKYLEKAMIRYREYSDLMSFNLRLYGLDSEASVFSGSLTEVKGSVGKEDNSDIYDVVRRKTGELITTFKNLFKEDLETENDAELLASAWYRVTYESPIKPRGLKYAILSFPWIMADILLEIQSRNSSVLKNSTKSEIGYQGIVLAKKVLSEEVGLCTVDRLNFFNHLRNLLLNGLKQSVSIELSGSTSLFLHRKTSDLNVWMDLSVERIPEVVEILESTFSVHIKGNYIEYRGSPFYFTIFFNKQTHLQVIEIKKVLQQDPVMMTVSLLLLQWARSQSLVRNTAKHVGKITATSLIILLFTVFSEIKVDRTNVYVQDSVFLIDDEVRRFTEMENALESLTSAKNEEVGKLLLGSLKYFAFEDENSIMNHIKKCESLKMSESGIRHLREYAFQAYHLLAQTLNIAQLWEISHSPDVEKEVTISSRRPRLSKKHGMSNSVFMEGASTVLFEESCSQNDQVHFTLYQLRRRPQHEEAQCYSVILADPNVYEPSDTTKYLYQQYFAHSFRQFDLARRTGSEDFGKIKATLKFGSLYVTNLPKLFQEESSSATVERVQEALRLGYKCISDVSTENFYKAKSAGFGIDFKNEDKVASPLISPTQTPTFDLEEIKNSLHAKEEQEDSFVRPIAKRKSALSSMSSSFEPYISNDESIKSFLEENGFILEKELSGYAVSMTLYNSSVKGDCDVQVIYSPKMEFLKLRYRPLRWSLVDVRSGSETQQDYRFILSSSKDVELDECYLANQQKTPSVDGMNDVRPDIRQLLKEGVVKQESNSSENNITLRVVPAFRDNEHLLIRSCHTCFFHLPNYMSRFDFIQKYPSLREVPQSILEKMRVMVTEVTEYSDHDPLSGLFLQTSDKYETELSFALDWEEMKEGKHTHELISSMWQIGLVFRNLLSSNE